MTNKRFLIVIGFILLITALGAGFILYSRKFEMKATEEQSTTTNTTLNSQATSVEKINGDRKFTLNVNKSTALPDGKDKINITFGAFWIQENPNQPPSLGASPSNPKPLCYQSSGEPYANDAGIGLHLIAAGTNTIIQNSSSIEPVIYNGGRPISGQLYYSYYGSKWSCSTGYATYNLSSTKAEVKSINFGISAARGGTGDIPDTESLYFSPSLSVSFSNTPTPTSTTTRKTTTTTRSTTPTLSISATLTPTPTIVKHKIPQPTPIVEDASEFFNTRNYVLTGLVVILLAGFITLGVIRQRKVKAIAKPPEEGRHD